MQSKTPTILLLLLAMLFQGIIAASYPTPVQPDLTYQTGVVTLFSGTLKWSGTYILNYNFAMTTSSLNLSLIHI